jgi:hypothetical protein
MRIDNGAGVEEAKSDRARMPSERRRRLDIVRGQSRVPEESFFYTRVVPILLISMAVIMGVLIIVAAGVLLGVVPFR